MVRQRNLLPDPLQKRVLSFSRKKYKLLKS
jgi:hypothetical protein